MNFEEVEINDRKIRDYLLSTTHPVGRWKEKFFRSSGFGREDWRVLATALHFHAQENPVLAFEECAYGRKAIIEGPLITPSGEQVLIRSVWFLATGTDRPRFVTAYPLRFRGHSE